MTKTFISSFILLLHRCIYVDFMRMGVYFVASILRWRLGVKERGVGFTLLCFVLLCLCILLIFCITHRIIALHCI